MIAARVRPLARAFLALLVGLTLALAASAADLAIGGARIYPSPDATAIERGTIVVRDGRIAAVGPANQVAVPAGAAVIDAAGSVVVANFWNSHVHLLPEPPRGAARRSATELEAALATMFTRRGFTTAKMIVAAQRPVCDCHRWWNRESCVRCKESGK